MKEPQHRPPQSDSAALVVIILGLLMLGGVVVGVGWFRARAQRLEAERMMLEMIDREQEELARVEAARRAEQARRQAVKEAREKRDMASGKAAKALGTAGPSPKQSRPAEK